jgi:hypothetical protein
MSARAAVLMAAVATTITIPFGSKVAAWLYRGRLTKDIGV